MPKKKKKAKRKVPPWGRPEAAIRDELGESFSVDVPLGNTDPTVVTATIPTIIPNWPKRAAGRLRVYRGKYT